MLEPRRLPKETQKAYQTFIDFLRLGPKRSFTGMAAKYGKDPSAYQKMAERNNWYERCEQYDNKIREHDAQIFEAQHAEAVRLRAQHEVQRQQEAWELAQVFGSVIRQFRGVEIIEEVEKAGKKVRRATSSAGAMIPVAMAGREYARLSRAAVIDEIEEQNFRHREMDKEGMMAGRRISGSFSVGDQMWGDIAPPDIPDIDAKPKALPPVEDIKPVVETPLVDLTGTEGLYDRKEED